MARFATKAAENEFYIARMEAAKFNDDLASREGASEYLGMDRTRLSRIELDSQVPLPEDVLLMADLYKRPELCNHYCTRICPIGKKTMEPMIEGSLPELAIKSFFAAHDIDQPAEEFLKMMEDGKLDSKDKKRLEEIIPEIKKTVNVFNTLLVMLSKELERGESID